jgi:hypothetical protein
MEKNGESSISTRILRSLEETVRKTAILSTLGACALLTVGVLTTGCKPDLPSANAQALIQAEYDHRPAAGVNITIDEVGLRQGVTAKYWEMTKLYPNKYWADFTLTPDGKKVVKLPKGGDVFEWRPDSITDKKFTVVIASVAATHLKALDLQTLQDEPGGKSVVYSEAVGLEGLPDPLVTMAHNASNKLASKHTADFIVDGGAWKLKSIE